MMWYDGGGDGFSWLWMAGMMVVFWGGVILLGVWAIRGFSGPRQTGDSAMETLRRRLAAGEISPEDFEKTRKALG
jgi:uncharacterized membrane protein